MVVADGSRAEEAGGLAGGGAGTGGASCLLLGGSGADARGVAVN